MLLLRGKLSRPLLVILRLVIVLEPFKMVVTLLKVRLGKALFVLLDMLHFLFFLLVELVILDGVAERLIGLELFFDHTLEHAIVRELTLQLHQLFAHLPFVVWLSKFFDSLLV